MKPIRTDGIRTLEDLKGRCIVSDETGCWLWQGATGEKRARLWFPPLQRTATLGVAIGFLRTGRESKPGVVWYVACDTADCANPEHRRRGDRRAQMLAAKIKRTTVQRMHMARGKQAVGKLARFGGQVAADDIRTSTEPLRVVAERYGISITTAWHIRRGEIWRPVAASPFAGLGG